MFVCTDDDADAVLNFYTLNARTIDPGSLPEELPRKLPRHPVPCVLLGRLAVDVSVHGRGLGGMLLADTVRRTGATSPAAGGIQDSEGRGVYLAANKALLINEFSCFMQGSHAQSGASRVRRTRMKHRGLLPIAVGLADTTAWPCSTRKATRRSARTAVPPSLTANRRRRMIPRPRTRAPRPIRGAGRQGSHGQGSGVTP